MTRRSADQDTLRSECEPEDVIVPHPLCLNCGKAMSLDRETYQNYQGPAPCPECKAHTYIIIEQGGLKRSLGGTRWEAVIGDLESNDIPVPILVHCL